MQKKKNSDKHIFTSTDVGITGKSEKRHIINMACTHVRSLFIPHM